MKKFILSHEHLIFAILIVSITSTLILTGHPILFLIFFTLGIIYRVIRGKKKGWTLPNKKTW